VEQPLVTPDDFDGLQQQRPTNLVRYSGKIALGLAHAQENQECQGQAGNTCDDKSPPPSEHVTDDTADQERQQDSDIGTDDECRHGRDAPFRRIEIGDDGVGRHDSTRLTYSHSQPCQSQLDEILGRTHSDCQRAPDGNGCPDDVAPVSSCRQLGNGESEQGIDHGEKRSGEQTKLGVGQ